MILEDIVEAKRVRLEKHKAKISEKLIKEMALSSDRESIGFRNALVKPGLSIIGEFKKASPSMGVMANKLEFTDRIDQYNHSVDAISVLTEEDYFNGGVEYLREVRKISQLPILRKDFIIDEYQVYEAKLIKADAILLIAAILDDERFKRLYDLAKRLGLDVLCEVHNEEEMERMLELDVDIIGINNRNLKTFEIDLSTTTRLAKLVPSDKVLVSESGVTTEKHIELLKRSNVNGLLIGRAFMESESPGKLATHWKKVYDAGN